MVALNGDVIDRLGNKLQVGDLVSIHYHSDHILNGKAGMVFRLDPTSRWSQVFIDLGQVIYDEPNEDWDEGDIEDFENDPSEFRFTNNWDVLPDHTGVIIQDTRVELISPVEIIGDNDEDSI